MTTITARSQGSADVTVIPPTATSVAFRFETTQSTLDFVVRISSDPEVTNDPASLLEFRNDRDRVTLTQATNPEFSATVEGLEPNTSYVIYYVEVGGGIMQESFTTLLRDPDVESRLVAVEAFETRLAAVEAFETRLAAVEAFETRLAAVEAFETRLAAVEAFETRLAAVEAFETRLAAVEAFETRLAAVEAQSAAHTHDGLAVETHPHADLAMQMHTHTHTHTEVPTHTHEDSDGGRNLVGVHEEDSKLAFVPNPTHDSFSILGMDSYVRIDIYDAEGRVVHMQTRGQYIDLAGYPAGIYIARVRTKQGTHTRQLVKK